MLVHLWSARVTQPVVRPTFTISRSEPAPVNHGDVAPLTAEGIFPGSFFSHKHVLLKKTHHFLRVSYTYSLAALLDSPLFATVSISKLFFLVDFCLVDVPPAHITVPLGKTFFPQGSPSRGQLLSTAARPC